MLPELLMESKYSYLGPILVSHWVSGLYLKDLAALNQGLIERLQSDSIGFTTYY